MFLGLGCLLLSFFHLLHILLVFLLDVLLLCFFSFPFFQTFFFISCNSTHSLFKFISISRFRLVFIVIVKYAHFVNISFHYLTTNATWDVWFVGQNQFAKFNRLHQFNIYCFLSCRCRSCCELDSNLFNIRLIFLCFYFRFALPTLRKHLHVVTLNK